MSNNGAGATVDPSATSAIGGQATATATAIVVTAGAGPAAAAALRRAAEQSQRSGVPLRIVHTWQLTALPAGDAGDAFWVASAADARARATRWVLEALGDSAATVRWTLDITELPAGHTQP